MVPKDEERGGKFDDLFEDLDRFFAQNNPGSPRPEPEGRGDDLDHPEELLPAGWEPDIEGIDLPTERESKLEAHETDGPAADDPAPDDRTQGDPTPDDREREDPLRSRDDRVAQDPTGGDPHSDDLVPDEPGEQAAEEDLHELTLHDLEKAPPEYRDLPRAEDAEDETEEPAEVGARGIRGEERPPESDYEVATWDFPPPEEPSADEPSADEPEFADVEAAADNLAASFEDRRDPGEVEEELLADIEEPSGPRTVRVGGPEPLTGPTWEEPTSHPILTEAGGPPEPGRNLPAAVLTAAGLAAVALLTLAWARAAFAVVASAVVLLGQAELYATMHRKGHQPATALGLVVGGFTLAGAYLKGEQAMAFFAVLGLLLSFLWYMAAVPKAREGAIANMATTMLGVLYVPFLAGYILIILAQRNSGRSLMLAILGLTFVYDIAAFLFGSWSGRRPLAPSISPRKSWEGLFGATVVTFALAIAILPSIHPLNLVKSVGLAVVVTVFAPLGDLAESSLKRDMGVKDMGSVLPGHGGVLDRIDSVLFVAPAAFYFLRLIF
jgi:phosphatidate cytidylyltransferase